MLTTLSDNRCLSRTFLDVFSLDGITGYFARAILFCGDFRRKRDGRGGGKPLTCATFSCPAAVVWFNHLVPLSVTCSSQTNPLAGLPNAASEPATAPPGIPHMLKNINWKNIAAIAVLVGWKLTADRRADFVYAPAQDEQAVID
jgi:hypothetical protein